MITWATYERRTWSDVKRQWGEMMRCEGLQEINRPAPTGYGEAPDLLKGKVEGPGFVIYAQGYDPRETNHSISSRAAIYGNRYCGTLNPF